MGDDMPDLSLKLPNLTAEISWSWRTSDSKEGEGEAIESSDVAVAVAVAGLGAGSAAWTAEIWRVLEWDLVVGGGRTEKAGCLEKD